MLSAQSIRLITSASQTIYFNEISFFRHAHFESLIFFLTSQWSFINFIIKLPLVNPDKYNYKWNATIMNSLDSRCASSSTPPPATHLEETTYASHVCPHIKLTARASRILLSVRLDYAYQVTLLRLKGNQPWGIRSTVSLFL